MRNALLMIVSVVLVTSCNSSFTKNIFGKKTPHESYAERLDDKGLDKTPEGKQWIAVSKTALENPVEMELPYRLHAMLQPEKPRALGLRFEAKQGQRLIFTINKKIPFTLYADLFRGGESTEQPLYSADTALSTFTFDIDQTTEYVLRLQPELYRIADFTISVSIGPSLHFPVSGTKAKPGSYWGDDRDGGKRSHEGIDIFAPKRTPVVAAADGVVTGVREGGLGGKTVWLNPEGKHYSLYYAHLDEQLVHEGQSVKKGTVLGLVGNTGNAKNTPSHLHFGVYTYAGAVNPLPFIDRSVKEAAALPGKSLASSLRIKKSQTLAKGTQVKSKSILQPLAVTAKGYIGELVDGTMIQVPFNAVEVVPSKNESVATEGSKRSSKG
jgi:murein DD-endopeptidase MepM/ murein hydrolase activator NlpD